MSLIDKKELNNIKDTSIDLSYMVPYVGNQGYIGSCIGFSITKAWEMGLYPNISQTDISPWFLYWLSQRHDRKEGEDYSGTWLIDALETFKKYGCCLTKEWDFDLNEEKYRGKPKENAMKDALHQKLSNFSKVEVNIDAFRYLLNKKQPIIISSTIYDGFEKTSKDGLVKEEIKDNIIGSHGLVIVGYDDTKRYFKLLNSWGESFGKKGYCYMSYDYLKSITNESYTLDYHHVNPPFWRIILYSFMKIFKIIKKI